MSFEMIKGSEDDAAIAVPLRKYNIPVPAGGKDIICTIIECPRVHTKEEEEEVFEMAVRDGHR